jgi:hypothetical protein
MGYINTTFAHGNGPFSRTLEWAIEVNNVREERSLSRSPIVVPLVYGDRQKIIMREEIKDNVSPDFLDEHPEEIILDEVQGNILNQLMFKGSDYAENLRHLANDYQDLEDALQRHLDQKRNLKYFDSKDVQIDLRDTEFQLGLNNRVQTDIKIQFYTAGGTGPFDEILERAILDNQIDLSIKAMQNAIPVAQRMIRNQRIVFSNDPGVFSYDRDREPRPNEIFTPPFIHPPKTDENKLSGEGVYVMMTGIDGVRESGMYDAVKDLGLQIYAPRFTIDSLPSGVKEQAIELKPSAISNKDIVTQYARAGWSSVWLSHMTNTGFISPEHDSRDDPEMEFNHRGMKMFELAAFMGDDARSALEQSIEIAKNVGEYNTRIINNYGTLDGIRYAAEIVVDYLEGKDLAKHQQIQPILPL